MSDSNVHKRRVAAHELTSIKRQLKRLGERTFRRMKRKLLREREKQLELLIAHLDERIAADNLREAGKAIGLVSRDVHRKRSRKRLFARLAKLERQLEKVRSLLTSSKLRRDSVLNKKA